MNLQRKRLDLNVVAQDRSNNVSVGFQEGVMNRMSLSRNQVLKHWVAILCAILLAGCAGAKLNSDYDEVTDKSLTTIQQKTDDFIETLITQSGTKKAAFGKHQDFYTDIGQQLRRLEFRVNSIPKNDKTIDLVKKIRLVIIGDGQCTAEGTSLRDLHCMRVSKEKGPSASALANCRLNVNKAISAALSLELSKKQGLEQN
jgi:hypothetical protein